MSMLIKGTRANVRVAPITIGMAAHAWKCEKCGNTAGYPVEGIPPERTGPFKSKEDAVRAATAHANQVCPA